VPFCSQYNIADYKHAPSSAVDTSNISGSGVIQRLTCWNTTNDFSPPVSGITSSPSDWVFPQSSILLDNALLLNKRGGGDESHCITKPYISSFGVAVDSSTAILTWDGSLNAADILWNNTGSTFSSTDNRIYCREVDKDDRGVGQFGVLFRDYTYQRILGGGRVGGLCQR
jgi:hypothetical protein